MQDERRVSHQRPATSEASGRKHRRHRFVRSNPSRSAYVSLPRMIAILRHRQRAISDLLRANGENAVSAESCRRPKVPLGRARDILSKMLVFPSRQHSATLDGQPLRRIRLPLSSCGRRGEFGFQGHVCQFPPAALLQHQKPTRCASAAHRVQLLGPPPAPRFAFPDWGTFLVNEAWRGISGKRPKLF